MTVIRRTGSENPERKYIARPIIDGHKRTVTGPTKSSVEEQVAKLKEQRRRRRLGIPDPEAPRTAIRLDALAVELERSYTFSERSKRTLKENLARSVRKFGHVEIHKLTTQAIETWLAGLGLAETTKRHTLKALRQAERQAATWGYATSGSARAARMPKEPAYKPEPFDTWDQVELVASHFKSQRDQALVLFACATGLRPQEWQALQWRDIDRKARVMRVTRAVQNGVPADWHTKTAQARRNVRLSARALAALDLLPVPLRQDQRVFPGDRGDIISLAKWRKGRWTDALTAAGVEYRAPKGMRDTFATLALTDRRPIEWISKQLGHRSVDVTLKHYAAWQPAADDRILDELNDLHASYRTQTGLDAQSKGQA